MVIQSADLERMALAKKEKDAKAKWEKEFGSNINGCASFSELRKLDLAALIPSIPPQFNCAEMVNARSSDSFLGSPKPNTNKGGVAKRRLIDIKGYADNLNQCTNPNVAQTSGVATMRTAGGNTLRASF